MFEWKDEYSIRIPMIDAQHQRLFALAGNLHEAMSWGKGPAALERALAQLIDYTKEHFAAEERLMRMCNFSDVKSHKKKHDNLTARVVEFQERFRRKEAYVTLDLMRFLKTWLAQHISRSDQEYAAAIRNRIAA